MLAVAAATAGDSEGIIGFRGSDSSLRMLLLLRLLLLLRMRAPPPMHVAHNSWSDTGRVPREGGVPKVGFPVWPKICALSQRWRQG